MRAVIIAAIIVVAGWFGWDYYQGQQAAEAAAVAAAEAEAAAAEAAAAEAAAAEAAAAEAAAAEAAAAEAAAAEAAAAEAMSPADLLTAENFDADKVIAMIETSSLSPVQKTVLTNAVNAARSNPELVAATIAQIREALGL